MKAIRTLLKACLVISVAVLYPAGASHAQNVGIGTNDPQARLHVNGNLKLQQGVAVNKFSTDSTFSGESHANIPTEKAIKDYLLKGFFAASYTETPALLTSSSINLSDPRGMAFTGSYAYVASGGNDQLCIFDLTQPGKIIPRGMISANLDEPVCVAIQGDFAYVGCAANNKLCIFDVSNVDQIASRGVTDFGASVRSIAVSGNYAWVVAGVMLFLVDISNPDVITILGSTIMTLNMPQKVFVQNDIAFVTSRDNNRLSVFYGLSLLGYISTNLDQPGPLFVKGNYAYVACNGKLCIFDISDPTNIVARGFITAAQFPTSLFVQNNYAYLTYGTAGGGGMLIFDISNPDVISLKGGIVGDLGYPTAVTVRESHIYITTSLDNLLAEFMLDPNKTLNITPTGITVSPSLWRNADFDENKIYTLKGNVGIGIIDPGAPLSFPPTTGKKITLYQGASNEIGMSVEPQLKYLQIYANSSSAGISFGYHQMGLYNERVRINSSGNVIDMAGGAYCTGTTWINASDRGLKENINPVNTADILRKIAVLPISSWNYKNDPPATSHIGPMAQDFYAIFRTGDNDKAISTIDPAGIALAGIQALLTRIEALEKEITKLKERRRNQASAHIVRRQKK